jgi:hypothetical protein
MDALDLDQDGYAQHHFTAAQHSTRTSLRLLSEISFTEFYAFFTTVYEASVPLAEAMLEDVVRKIFERDFVKLVDVLFGHFDKNSDGVLDLAEVKSLVGKPKEGEAFMKAIDENGDKVLAHGPLLTGASPQPKATTIGLLQDVDCGATLLNSSDVAHDYCIS